MKKRIAILSAPPIAPDGLADMQRIWGSGTEIRFFSVLPDTTPEAVAPYTADAGDRILMLGLGEGAPTMISINKLTPQIEALLAALQGQADFAFFACAGDFPRLNSPLPIIQPNMVFRNMIKTTLQSHMRLGVITPGEKQIPHVHASWLPYLAEAGLSKEQLVVDWAPPSKESATRCAQRLAAQNIDLVAVECLGFKEELREMIAREVKKPVILVRTVVAHLVREMIGVA